jgi:hypothetical protein
MPACLPACLPAAACLSTPVDALALQQQQAVLVVVYLLDVQVLARFEVHDMNVEVILVGGRHQLAQYKHLGLHRQYRFVVCSAVLKLWFALSSERGQAHAGNKQAAGVGRSSKG